MEIGFIIHKSYISDKQKGHMKMNLTIPIPQHIFRSLEKFEYQLNSVTTNYWTKLSAILLHQGVDKLKPNPNFKLFFISILKAM